MKRADFPHRRHYARRATPVYANEWSESVRPRSLTTPKQSITLTDVTVKQARDVARQWMVEEAIAIPGFRGAYTAGSTNWLSEDAGLPATSDLDVMVVLAEPNRACGRRKFLYHGVLLEVSYLCQDQFQSPSRILSDYHLAPSFRTTKIMADPVGFLEPLFAEVCRDYVSGC